MPIVRTRTSRNRLGFEQLEVRLTMSASQGHFEPASAIVFDAAKKKHVGASYPFGLSPAQTKAYYGFDQVSFGGVAADGASQTIAIITAKNNPNLATDLAAFDEQFGLPDPPSLRVVNQVGGAKLPKNSKSWGSETALDVEWAHAIAPGANILVVEAKSASLQNFMTAIDYARHVPGVTVISVSAAGDEFKQESIVDSIFQTPPSHEGVTFVFASGDEGGTAEYPSSSPYVLSVGGTTIQGPDETVWSYGGGGTSKYEGVPSYQDGLGLASRGTPDVSYDADPNTGFSVLDSYGFKGWVQYGGTSAGAPQWAALLAIANQGRELAGKAPLANAQAALYAMPSRDFYDVTSGNNQQYYAGPGYDLASGLGTPFADRLIPDLVAFSGSTDFTVGPPPVVTKDGKTKPHFTTGVDATLTTAAGSSLDRGIASLRSLAASLVDVAYAENVRYGASLTLVDVAPSASPSAPASGASSGARFGSAKPVNKADVKPASDGIGAIDAVFAGLGDGIAAA
jgi:hypothetical protein